MGKLEFYERLQNRTAEIYRLETFEKQT